MEETGLRFNTGKLKWSLVSWRALGPMVQVLMYGAHKYTTFKRDDGSTVTGAQISKEDAKGLEVVTSGANNWKGGLKYTEVCESMQRHMNAFIEGEDDDKESKLSHVGHILCNAMFLSYMVLFRKDLDDRHIDQNLKK